MSKKGHLTEEQARYRREIGRQFAQQYRLSIGDGTMEEEVRALYNGSDNFCRLSAKTEKMTDKVLGRIIASVPSPKNETAVPLLMPLGKEGLSEYNFLRLSGREYLERMAHAAIVGAVYEHLKEKQAHRVA